MLNPLTSATVMAYFDQTKETELITDADHLLVSQLFLHRKSQDQTNETLLHISVVRCRTLRDDRYYQTEREAPAIVWAIERLHIYLYEGHFTLIPDCKPVELILNNPQSRPPARIERWNLRLQDYEYKGT